MTAIGLTGGIGCGKTYVARLLAAKGARVLESDQLAKDVLQQDPEVIAAVTARWGDQVRAESGDEPFDRAAIAKIVFNDDAELRWLEAQLHPRVRKVWETAVREAGEEPLVVEIPLLFEKNLETSFALTVCVSASPDVQEARLRQRGLDPGQIAARQRKQLPLTEKRQRADVVLSNSGTRVFLEAQLSHVATCWPALSFIRN